MRNPFQALSSTEEIRLLNGARAVILPILVSVVVAGALFTRLPVGLGSMQTTNLLCVSAAFLALWIRPEDRGRAPLVDWITFALWGLLFIWLVGRSLLSNVPDASYPYLILTLDAALLWYASRRATCSYPRFTFLIFLLVQAGALGLRFFWQGRIEISSQSFLVGGLLLTGLLVLLFTLLPAVAGWRWWFRVAVLLAIFAAFWFARTELQRQWLQGRETISRFPRQAFTAHLTRQEMTRNLFVGIGPGTLDRRLRAQGAGLYQGAPPPPDPTWFPRQAPLSRTGEQASSPVLSAGSFLGIEVVRVLEPQSVRAVHLLALEMGLIGMGLALAVFLLLTMRMAAGILPRAEGTHSLAAAGFLAVWIGLLTEAALGLALYQPYGILLVVAMAGLVWGAVPARPSGPTFSREFSAATRWVALGGSLLAALAIILLATIPGRGLVLLGMVPGLGPDTPEAIAILTRAGKLNPFSSEIRLELAESLRLQAADPQRVRETLEEAIDRDVFHQESYAALARFFLEQSEMIGMEETIERGRRHCPGSYLLAAWEAEQALQVNDPARAVRAFADAARLASSAGPNLQAWFLGQRAALLEKQGNLAAALEAYCELYQIKPGDPEFGETISRLARKVYGG
ncbi:hypothetical protein HQ520_00805 [bacterium]|nr:hypothetical protein [bacterium]